MMLQEPNMVTISLNEYYELREKANMNGFLMRELGRMEARFERTENKLVELEERCERRDAR